VSIDLAPLVVQALHRQPGQRVHLVAGVFEHVGEHGLEHGRALREDQAELAQQAAQAVDARGAIGLQAFAQAVHAQHALLLDALDGHEVRSHRGVARCSLRSEYDVRTLRT
jgi:hypothetical protein